MTRGAVASLRGQNALAISAVVSQDSTQESQRRTSCIASGSTSRGLTENRVEADSQPLA